MTSQELRAVVVGAGWAGEGHTRALQHCGVDVVSICARNEDVVHTVAERLGVANPSTDWRKSITTFRPDIVTIGTPADLRAEVVELAADLGCHILCEKPLALNAGQAEPLVRIVERAGVKNAYASTNRYDAGAAWAAELIDQGIIGVALH
ncbi:MAG: Gfo/Idh/MocA family oxidoreductase [Anaerolineae bacterium]|nr:Gfo/Idh/MocA family oxidoreductase [Anaerolineae bacterium]